MITPKKDNKVTIEQIHQKKMLYGDIPLSVVKIKKQEEWYYIVPAYVVRNGKQTVKKFIGYDKKPENIEIADEKVIIVERKLK